MVSHDDTSSWYSNITCHYHPLRFSPLVVISRARSLLLMSSFAFFSSPHRFIVCNSPRFSHCTPLLSELHWLPIKQRIISKTLLITYKAIHGKAPVYIQELLEMKSSSQTYYRLRSSQDQTLLKYPSGKSEITLGDRAFMCYTII